MERPRKKAATMPTSSPAAIHKQTHTTRALHSMQGLQAIEMESPHPAKRQRTLTNQGRVELAKALGLEMQADDNTGYESGTGNETSQETSIEDEVEGFTFAPTPKCAPRKPRATVPTLLAPRTAGFKVAKTRASRPCKSTADSSKDNESEEMKPIRDSVANWKAVKGIDETLPPIHDIEDIFEDMAKKAIQQGLGKALEALKNQEIRVATMCSGTESPILALDLIFNAVERMGGQKLHFKHLFSAEIVPFKQAYIERNFHPEIIFRDIRELAEDRSTASTAYGGPAKIPSNVDILVAGFSCVDFSKLNKWTKSLSDVGESGDTFRAILNYAKKYRPAIVILENICGAPWNFIKAVWENNQESLIDDYAKGDGHWKNVWDPKDPAYAASWLQLDTKDYYIPQTRNRKYMICIDRKKLPSADAQVKEWATLIKKFMRPASSPVEAFLLDQDDPRLHRAREELAKTGRGDVKPRKETNWTLCQGRHQDYRSLTQIGVDRPITRWVDGGSCKPPDFWWQDWALAQVERVWDTCDISFLRNVRRDFDSHFKARVWELSQNVDRFTDTVPFGVTGCVTPSGSPYLTTRGGPVVGLEAIALQGLPIDKLLLTRETQRELQDLAGNAMTSTVIGGALLSALIIGHEALVAKNPAPFDLSKQPAMIEMNQKALQCGHHIEFAASEQISVDELCEMANSSVRLCYCEGTARLSNWRIQKCKECLHTTCEKCGGNPSHDYEVMDQSLRRTYPRYFAQTIRNALPMRLCILGLDHECLETSREKAKGSIQHEDWMFFLEKVKPAFGEELRFQSVTRTHCWTIVYDAPSSWLQLEFVDKEVTWRLFAKPDHSEPANSKVRELLKHPFARMMTHGPDILQGQWQISVPVVSSFSVTISGKEELVSSWESRLGIQSSREADKKIFSSLTISVDGDKTGPVESEIAGDFKLLPNCGTACGSLHKKTSPTRSDQRSLYLFLDPARIGNPKDDQYVFATTKHFMIYEEVRQIVACLDTSWRPSHIPQSVTSCFVIGEWLDCVATLQAVQDPKPAMVEVPVNKFPVRIAKGISTRTVNHYHCSSELIAVLSCVVPNATASNVLWKKGGWSAVDQTSERQMFSSFAWLTERVRSLGGFASSWRPIELPERFVPCATCAPIEPNIQWSVKLRGDTARYLPYEDGKQAGIFERAIKNRPPPFTTYVRIDDDNCGCLMIGLNIPTLAHRALAKFQGLQSNNGVNLFWRLVTQYQLSSHYALPAFILTSNEGGREADHEFMGISKAMKTFSKGELRQDQKRSLQWMIEQEAENAPIFYEQEIEEAALTELGWRAEARVRRARIVKGGVLADEVGYGKTAIILALIDKMMREAKEHAITPCTGCIPLRATLIVVPKTLTTQWANQVKKFFDESKFNVVVLEDMTHLNKTSIGMLQSADIVIASWSLFTGATYLERLSAFSALPAYPSMGGRAFDAWLSMVCQRIAGHTEELKRDGDMAEFAEFLKQEAMAAENDEKLVRSVPSKRLHGQEYFKDQQKAAKRKGDHTHAAPQATPNIDPEATAEVDPHATSELDRLATPEAEPQATAEVDQHAASQVDSQANPGAASPDKSSDEKKKPLKDKAPNYGPFKFENAESMVDVKSPPLQMFHFARLVVDEYTYVKGTNYSLISSLQATNRWVLSGTPPLDDFADVKTLAGFLGVNLGIDDDATGFLKGQNIKAIRRDRTAAEEFRAFTHTQSPAWHLHRQKHAQAFLNHFVRQNTPEIELIKHHEVLRVLQLPAMERAINMELQQQLSAQELNICRGGKGRKDSDRVKRLKDLMKSSKTVEEAMLKRCSFFTLKDSSGRKIASSKSSDFITNERQKQYDDLREELKTGLRHAIWLEHHLAGPEGTNYGGTHFHKWETNVHNNGFDDGEGTQKLIKMIKDARKDYDSNHEEQFYRDPPTAKQLSDEKAEYKKQVAEEKQQKKNLAEAKEAKRKAKKAAQPKQKGKQAVDTALDSSDSEVEQDEEAEELAQDAEGQYDPSKTKSSEGGYVPPRDLRAIKLRAHDKAGILHALRVLAGHLRSLSLELVARIRALRFFEVVCDLQRWQCGLRDKTEVFPAPSCLGCGHQAGGPSEIFLLGICGHLACKICLEANIRAGACVAKNKEQRCGAAALPHHIHSAIDLGVEEAFTGNYGSKLDAIITLIKNKIPDDEQVLLFVQFDDLMGQIATALKAEKIKFYALTGKTRNRASIMMTKFQEDSGDGRKKVLMLNSSNETAAGANLTNANHVIFVSPPFTTTKQAYHASLKQSIGRALRFGQKKEVVIYKFLVLKTIDVDILQKRTKKKLIQLENGEWEMKAEEDLTAQQKEVDWASGFVKPGYLDVEDLEGTKAGEEEHEEEDVTEMSAVEDNDEETEGEEPNNEEMVEEEMADGEVNDVEMTDGGMDDQTV